MARRILILLSQFPLDPTSGACRSVSGIGELLAALGFDVHALGTTATEHTHDGFDAEAHVRALKPQGLSIDGQRPARVVRFTHRDVPHTLLDTRGHAPTLPLRAALDPAFESLLDEELASFKPEAVLVFGRAPAEMARHARARATGAAVVLTVRNHGYYDRRAFDGVDAVLTTSEFLARQYKDRVGVDSVAITSPVDPADVVAHDREPLMLTYATPSYDKGVVFFARLAHELATSRPDIPILVVESRGSAGVLLNVARSAGFDLARHESILVSPGVAAPADLYRPTRLMLVPSAWEEPLGRVAVEAMMNGVPPIVSGRGALPEVVGSGGLVCPLPTGFTERSLDVPPAASVRPWLAAIERLFDDEAEYARTSALAKERSRAFEPAVVNPRYVEFFDSFRRPPPAQPTRKLMP